MYLEKKKKKKSVIESSIEKRQQKSTSVSFLSLFSGSNDGKQGISITASKMFIMAVLIFTLFIPRKCSVLLALSEMLVKKESTFRLLVKKLKCSTISSS